MVEGLGARGRRLWDALSDLVDGERGRVLLEEAARIADRLDGLHALLAGDAMDWVTLVEEKGAPDTLAVKIDAALAEARQQAGMLRSILTTLPVKESDDRDRGGAWLDDL
jgi:hypothetical protein